jgi:CBS domain-containing protein
MKARDVMVAPVITTSPHASVKDVAQTLLKHHISALPVTDDKGRLVGIISEGDLLHRHENNTEPRSPWWLLALTGTDALAADYIKGHARKVADVMTRDVVSASPETPLYEIASLLEKHAIKRVPIVENGHPVGIVSRSNLVQAVAGAGKHFEMSLADETIRSKLLSHLKAQPWAHVGLLNVTVNGGVVDLWGIARSETERKAIRVAAEGITGVRAVNDNMRPWPTLAEG